MEEEDDEEEGWPKNGLGWVTGLGSTYFIRATDGALCKWDWVEGEEV